jgi:PAS domain S-box-containing protein
VSPDPSPTSVSDPDSDDGASYRERVYAAFADPDRDCDAAIDRALQVGSDRLGTDVGFLTRVDDVQTIERAVGDAPAIEPGESCPLDRAYCRRTVERDTPLSVQDAAVSELIDEAAYTTFQLGSYIGCRVVVDDEVYGTVCFADADPRDRPFSEADQLFVELVARLVGNEKQRRTHERTLRRRNERLFAERERFAGIADTSFDVIFRLDEEGRFTYLNSAVERLLGYATDEMNGDPFTDYLAESSLPAATGEFVRLTGGETVEAVDLDFVDGDGDVVTMEVNARPVSDSPGPAVVQGVARDVTTRREREAELRTRNRAIAAADVGIVISDATRPDNPVTYVNDAFVRLTGYTAAEMEGANCRILQGPDTDPETVARLREAVDAREPVEVELLNYRRDGTPFWNRVTVTPVADDDGEVTHFVGFQRDVTERARTERLFELLNRVLRHNLRNDLNVVLGYGEMLAEAVDATRPDAAATAAERIRETTTELLSLSERARELETVALQDHEPTRLGTASLLDRIAADARDRFPEARIDVAVETGRDLCAGPEVERALAELVANAVTHDPSSPTQVTIGARDDGDLVAVTVADDGPGVPATEAAVVQHGRETPLEHGTGLGLWLVNWIVTCYGGSFQLEPRPEGGTVATASLPGLATDERVGERERRPTTLSR